MAFFDLASLAKPLVTARLALAALDLDQDRRAQLGFLDRAEPLTVRQLLSHSAGLPPWLPYTGEPLAEQLKRGFPQGAHPKLVAGTVGVSLYSDLGYRLLAELLELESGRSFQAWGAVLSGLSPAPWEQEPAFAPQGPDATMWRLAEPALPLPVRERHLPNDANARAGMRGHAGFGATPEQLRVCLEDWVVSGTPLQSAVDTARAADGARWGLGLQRALAGSGRFGTLLARIPSGVTGVHVHAHGGRALSSAAPVLKGRPGEPTRFWFHLGFTGPALFFRPEDGLCLAILAHRVGPRGELLDDEAMRARRWEALEAAVAKLGAPTP